MLGVLCAALFAFANPALPQMTVSAPPLTTPSSGTVHMRITLAGHSDVPLRLHFWPYVTNVDGTITLANGKTAPLHGGTLVPYAQREIPSTDPMVALPAAISDPATIDLTVSSEDTRFAVPQLQSNYPANPATQPAVFYLLTIGLLIGIALYHLTLFAALRDRSIGLYVVYLAAFLLYELVASGLAWEYVWPQLGIPEVAALRVAAAIVAVAVMVFARRFMRTHEHTPLLDAIFMSAVGVTVGLTVIGLAVPSTAAVTSLLADIGLLAAILACTACAIACVRAGERSAMFFLIGFSGLFVGGIAKILTDDLGQISNAVHFYGVELGVCFDSVVLALGLADRIRREQAQRERAEALASEQERLARTDPLTGVANRRLFDERLLAEWNRAVRHSLPLAVIMVDVDRFKPYNDKRGHLAGDDCLKLLARACQGSVHRADEIFARYGGEEFAAILPGSTLEQAVRTAEAMVRVVRDLDIAHPEGGIITISAGVAAYEGGPFADVDILLADADAALYSVKSEGGDDVRSHTFPNEAFTA